MNSSSPTGRRLAAFLIDFVIATVVVVVGLFTILENDSTSGNACDLFDGAPSDTYFWADYIDNTAVICIYNGSDSWVFSGETGKFATFQLLGLGLFVGNQVVLQGLTGATVGKFVTGVRAVNAMGRPCGIPRALGRSLLLVVDAFPWVCVPYALGAGMIAFTSSHRRVGDLACGTYVVDRRAMGMAAGSGTTFGAPSSGWQNQPAAAPTAGGWTTPGASPTAAPATGGSGQAQWDAARNTYIQHDGSRWLEFDQATQQWKPMG